MILWIYLTLALVLSFADYRQDLQKPPLLSSFATYPMASSNEKIFLDSEQSSIIASGLDSAAQAGLTRISLARNEAIMQMENFYDLSKTALETTCTALSAGEIETILISEGVSKTDIVEPLRSHFDAEVTKATAIATAFSNVRSDIESAIKKMTEEDAQLAGDFNQWSKI